LFVNRMACLERGGGETFDLEISRHVARAGAQVTCLCGAPLLRPAPLPVAGARTLRTPWLRRFPWDKVKGGWRVRQLEFELFEWRAARWIERHAAEFDVIQVCELPNLVHWLKQRGVKTPVVMRLTAPNYHDPRGGVRQADALIASGTSIQKLRELGLEVADIPNAVDADRFRPQPSDFRETHGIGRDEFVALYVARFQAFKNHAMLLEAFALFTREHPAARLVLAGSGPLRERCEQQAKALGIAGQVLFLGEMPFDDLPSVYAAADVKVISSDYESFCFAAIEAMSAGLPVLTTDCAWVPRLVADGAGMVVPVGDAEAFAAGLKKLADNPALRQRMGAAGRQQVLERHTWPASAEKLLGLYRRLQNADQD
nr:glycosyltransferase family 4 protein [Kiritimatiellia bacterium]